MPQRFLRPGITTSEGWNSVSWECQSFYVRLLTIVDDWGRYDARAAILCGQLFPLRPEITVEDTQRLLEEAESRNLLITYECEGKKYLQVTKWKERARGPSKFPEEPAGIRRNPQESAADRSGPQESAAESCLPSLSHESSISKPSPRVLAIAPAHAVAAPSRRPATVEEVIEAGKFIGMAETDCRQWFTDMQASNWAKFDGTPFGNWRREQCAARDRLRSAPGNVNGGKPRTPTTMDLRNVLQAKEKICADFKLAHCSDTAGGDTWDNPDNRKRYQRMRREVREMNQRIASFYEVNQ